ncbi:MAG: tandem-95 repeat protein, partial [Verrucomicrobiota bacterium]
DAPTLDPLVSLTINEDAPMQTVNLTGIGSGALNELQPLLVTATSSDLTVIAQPTISYATPNATGSLSFAPVHDANGTATIAVTVDDGSGAVVTRSFAVRVLAVNDAPTLDPLVSLTINEDAPMQTVNLTGIGSGALNELQPLLVTAISSDLTVIAQPTISYVTPNAMGSLSFAPVHDANGTATITVTVDDSSGVNAVVTGIFTVRVLSVNDAPTISKLTDQTINENMVTTGIPFRVDDVETPVNKLKVTVSSSDTVLVPNANIVMVGNETDRVLTIQPAANRAGTAKILITVDDGDGGLAVANLTLTVKQINQAPSLSDVGKQFTLEGQATSPITFTVSDAETDATSLKVRGSSSDTNLVPNENFSFTNSKSNWMLIIKPTPGRLGTATITLTVSDGVATTSKTFDLTINPVPPRITGQPGAAAVRVGVDVWFFVEASGSEPLNYQWKFNGSDIRGAVGTNLILSAVTPQQAGEYTVAVTNRAGSSTSQVATLTIFSAPVITRQPRSQIAAVASTLRLDVTVNGEGPLFYQWRVNGVNLKGSTDATLQIPNAQPVNSGDYSCAISSPYGVVNSETAGIVIAGETLEMTDNFVDRKRLLADSGIGQSSNIGATKEARESRHAGKAGGKSMWISWIAPENGIAKWETLGSSFDTLLAVYSGNSLDNLIEVASDEDSGGFLTSAVKFNAVAGIEYEIAVDGFAGKEGNIVLSWSLIPAPDRLPEIVAEPGSQTVGVGANVLFSVLARGSSLGYQWFLNDSAIPGALGTSYAVNNVQIANVGNYRVRVTSRTQSVDSQPGVLQLNSNAGIADVRGIATTDKLADTLATAQASPLVPQSIPRRPAIRRSSNGVARGYTGTQIFSTVGSTREEGEPNHCGEIGGASQWFAYQAEFDAVLTISTDGSDFDTVLAVYTGSGADFASLREIACDNDSGADGKDSLVRIQAVAGTVYYVAVDGVHAATGNVQLNYSLAVPLRLSAAKMENGRFRLSLNGQPGGTYTIQGSVDLLTWFPLQTVQTATGAIEIADTNSTSFRWRSYRAVKQ